MLPLMGIMLAFFSPNFLNFEIEIIYKKMVLLYKINPGVRNLSMRRDKVSLEGPHLHKKRVCENRNQRDKTLCRKLKRIREQKYVREYNYL